MSCKLSKGNCPFCDAESGFPSTWGMSPMGWNDMKTRHDNGHPESKKCEENRADEINKLCDSAFGVGKREEKCQKEYFPVPKLPDFSGIPPIVMPCQCYAEITHLGYGCPCKCHLKEEYKCKTCGGDAFSCKGCQDSKEGWCACGEPKKEGFEYHSTDECKKCDDSIYNASAFTHDPSDCSSCLHGESAKKLREETHTVEPQPRDSYIREGLECICIGKCHCKPKEKKFYSGWGSLAEDFKVEEPKTLPTYCSCPKCGATWTTGRHECPSEEPEPECEHDKDCDLMKPLRPSRFVPDGEPLTHSPHRRCTCRDYYTKEEVDGWINTLYLEHREFVSDLLDGIAIELASNRSKEKKISWIASLKSKFL